MGGLIAELGNSNITRRMLAMNQLVDRIGQSTVRPVEKMLRNTKSSAGQKSHGLWALLRLAALKPETVSAAAHDADRLVRVHAMRVISEMSPEVGLLPGPYRQLVFEGLNDRDPYVQRAAADALGQHAHGTEHGDYEPVHRLLDLLQRIPANDAQLLHVCRMALRNHLRLCGAFPHLESQNLSEQVSKAVADIALGVAGEETASFLLKHVEKFPGSRARLTIFLRHAARYTPEPQLNDFAKFIREKNWG